MPGPDSQQPTNNLFAVPAAAVLLVIATFVAYFPALNGAFVWDDESWTRDIGPLLADWRGLLKMWTSFTSLQQYFPFTGTTFWLDHHLWGDVWTLPYHVENVALHAISALLVWRLLFVLRVPGAWLAGAVFALHPVMAESVAWITERKNVLSMFFYLAALLAWLHWSGLSTGKPARNPVRTYAVMIVLFICALLSKATAFSFPAAVLLITWWRQGRLQWRADLLPALPLFIVAIAHGLLVRWIEIHHVGADGTEWPITTMERPIIAGRAFWFYIGKLLWPADLRPIYPRWDIVARDASQWIAFACACVVLVAAWLLRAKVGRGVVAAVFFFTGTLLPVLGFLEVYGMVFSFVADRWVYVSSLGVIALVCAAVERASLRLARPALALGIAIVLLPVLATLTWRKSALYRDNETLMRAALEGNPNCWLACYNLANQLADAGDGIASEHLFRRAIEIWPGYAKARTNYGSLLIKLGRVDEAIVQLQRAISDRPEIHGAYFNLGLAQVQKGDTTAAEHSFESAIERLPDFREAHQNLAFLIFARGDTAGALAHSEKVVALAPHSADARRDLAVVLASAGRVREAQSHLQTAIDLDAGDAASRRILAHMLATNPDETMRDGTRALTLAHEAVRLSGGHDATSWHTLAAACAETGDFIEAISTSQRALDTAIATRDESLAASIREAREFYLAGKPLRAK